MIIDANIYWFPEQLFTDDKLMEKFMADIPRVDNTRGLIKTENNHKQIVIERPIGYPSINFVQGEYELESMCNALKESGIDRAVMKVPCCHEWMGIEMCRLFNDGMAYFQKASGGKLISLAVIPPWGTKESFEELDRCKNELGMHGVQLCAHYGNLYLDDEAFAPLFEKLNEYKLTVYVHHTPLPVQYDSLCEYNNLRRSYGRCTDQTIAISRELLSGMFHQYPHVKLVHSMLGGGYFVFLNMMFPPKTTDTTIRFDAADDQMHNWLQKNIYFEMSHAQPWGKLQLECAVKTVGADHVVYGSSYPVRQEWMTNGPDFVRDLDISEKEKMQILYENAAELYNISLVS